MHTATQETSSFRKHLSLRYLSSSVSFFLKSVQADQRCYVMDKETSFVVHEDPGVYVIQSGLVLVMVGHEDGSRSAIELLRPGSVYGLDFSDWRGGKILRTMGKHAHTFIVSRQKAERNKLTPSGASEVHRNRIRNLERRALWAQLPMEDRVHHAFCDLASCSSGGLWLDLPEGMTQKDFAFYIGSTRENVNRIFASLKRDGALHKNYRGYHLLKEIVFPE